jgi:hypothetical protein
VIVAMVFMQAKQAWAEKGKGKGSDVQNSELAVKRFDDGNRPLRQF